MGEHAEATTTALAGARPFGTVLVANRGEIACRILRTLRQLGIRSVAVSSDADDGAPHVALADVAVRIGRSYLDVDAIVAAADATGADAVHPGYGFLSESPALARACERAGIAFVGPSPDVLELMGDKLAAKARVAERGVPVVPGTQAAGLDDDALVQAAADLGFPLLVKPSAGGGGKGMAVASSADELPAALASARRIARGSFGDDTLLLERLVETPRHIEVQVLADAAGAVVHLGERECTLQRRHQKVVEEAPSPLLTPAMRERMGAAACDVARSVAYTGAGTVEFLVPADDPDEFFFIEMNTRLQVEHPVTELVTGLDLVELQLRVAAGEPLPLRQGDVELRGHAIEARVYAESPARGFLPATGTVLAFSHPDGAGLRMDAGVVEGQRVGTEYDPLLAKAVAHGADRAEALRRVDALLAGTVLLGVETNVGFLRALLADDDVRAGRLDTGLIGRFLASADAPRSPGAAGRDRLHLVAAGLFRLVEVEAAAEGLGPWAARDGWRLNAPPRATAIRFVLDGVESVVEVVGASSDARVGVDGVAPVAAALRPGGAAHAWRLDVDGVSEVVHLASDPETGAVWVALGGATVELRTPEARERAATQSGPTGPEVLAHMPGTVVAVAELTNGSARVEAGDTLVVVEAMKMEHPLTAPHAGLARLEVRTGDLVRAGQVVAVVEPEPTPVPAAHPAAGAPPGPHHPQGEP
ncbi:Carbamoyl-phosphate synthase L chain ATP-binding [Beutenbergia cavernae DSM 12333]|uniref:biotin carboxylase n=1 Tax=Beutenbergia cavernae (strain ATCC BAA-8 / DSM 12333 / CCUG 43141 / JCM 11478 / NBRC 16432 / NCIMB 13614 / HKI 0122) TaxID=471853 RepID=C5C4G9_BEUC1|nr:biotin carboxylase N-terminal domain-containing protein [Beutenbergia cavernae]ACQ82093.1 Carbamoyl-phosphate synthase L chain ATP-binding [Beutenbergia cavernae DSM 12333]